MKQNKKQKNKTYVKKVLNKKQLIIEKISFKK